MLKRINYWVLFFVNYKNWWEVLYYRFSGKRTTKVFLRNGLRFFSRKNSPLSVVVDEIILLKRYTPYGFEIKKGDIVVDIGGHTGVFSLMARQNGADRVLAFEPYKENVKMIKKNITVNKLKNIFVRNYAIADKKSEMKLFLETDDGGNSLFPNPNGFNKNTFQIVKSIKLADIFTNEKIKSIDFLKIDCEGAAGLIIRSTPSSIWNKIDKVSMEFHDKVSSMSHFH